MSLRPRSCRCDLALLLSHSQPRQQHMGRVVVRRDAVELQLFAEIPLLGTRLAHSITLPLHSSARSDE